MRNEMIGCLLVVVSNNTNRCGLRIEQVSKKKKEKRKKKKKKEATFAPPLHVRHPQLDI